MSAGEVELIHRPADEPAALGHTEIGSALGGQFQHLRRQVDTDHLGRRPGQMGRNDPGTTGHVDHPVAGGERGERAEGLQRPLLVHGPQRL